MKPSSIRASVIIPTYGRSAYLGDALTSVMRQTLDAGDFEVIVVDNKPDSAVLDAVSRVSTSSNKHLLYVQEPALGLHQARHAGARIARGEVLVYIDDDVLTPEGWLGAILVPFEDPAVAMAGGKVLPLWESEVPAWVHDFPQSYLSLLDIGDQTQRLQGPWHIHGCNMAVRCRVLFEVGGFHPDAMGSTGFHWMRGDGETGLHRKIFEAAYKTVYEPRAWLYHRIPSERLTPGAFKNKGTLVGLTLSYSALQASSENRLLPVVTTGRASAALLRALMLRLASALSRQKKIRLLSDAHLWLAYGKQQLVALFSKSKRALLLKRSHL